MADAAEVAEVVAEAENGAKEDLANSPEVDKVEVPSEDGKGEDGGDVGVDDVDAELEAMKKRLAEMEAEAEKLKGVHEGTVGVNGANGRGLSSADTDARSVYVGQVDYGATPEELQAHFADCGTINRVTILCNKYTGQPKGYAYIEFVDEDAVKNAIILNDSTFRGRQLKVTAKRTNIPGMGARGGWRGRGRGYRGRGRGFGYGYRGGYRGRYSPY